MKNNLKLVVVLVLALFFSGTYLSLPPLPGQASIEVEGEVEKPPESPSFEWFAEQIAQLERAQAQKLLDESKALKNKLEAEIGAVQRQIGEEILKLQLQLVLVSLDGQGQLIILERLDQLQKELENWQEKAQIEYEQGLAQLKLDHQLELQKALAVLTSP